MKYKRWFAIVIVICMTLPLAACHLKPAAPWPALREGSPREGESCLREGGSLVRGNGKVVERKTPLPEDERGYALRVKGISLRGSAGDIELVIDESLPREVVLAADENIAAYINVDYNAGAGEIVIDLKQRVVFTPTKLSIVVGAPVRALDVNGAWHFTYDCPSVTACEVSVNGASNGKLAFGALEALRVDVNGASDIKLAGTAKLANLTINGAANIRAFDLAAVAADVTINGAGDCEITATGILDAEINGVGKVVYDGQPAVSPHIRGLGEVRAR